ncbi:MAG TPA: proprotein convertase P-domain-containing protein [Phycisphaerae bacterium]|nr:proprotein convertase P-domain-containing protein [Phycisphaerae bacterium]
MSRTRKITRLGVLVAVGVMLVLPAVVKALPPTPANDNPASAEIIGPDVPLILYGTTVLAANSINSTSGDLPAIDSYMDGPDVFYSFTPNATDTYRVQLLPWQGAPLRSSDRRFTIYVYEAVGGTFLEGTRAPGSARPVDFDALLTAGTEYIIGVDHDSATHDNFDFTLMVDTIPAVIPDDCVTAEDLPAALPAVALNDIDGAAADFTFTQGTGRCAVSGSTPTTAPGNDHVYHFVAPADGDYAVELASDGFDGVLYVADSCPPFFPLGCLGASNHSTSGTSGARHELVVVTLDGGKDYYIYVDNGSSSITTGSYALIIDDAFNYEINEIEPNDVTPTATPLTTPLNGAQLVGSGDEDYWAVTGLTGDRVYAYVNNGGSSNSTLDTQLRFYEPDGSTLIEYDDDDGDGIDSPIEDLRYIYSTTSSVIAGAQMTADGTHFLHVRDNDSAGTSTIHRYRFHTGVEPATRAPLAECEPNDALESADFTGKHYYSGVIDTVEDLDFYAFEAVVGDRVFIAFDGDPERDSTGSDSANDDPNAFHGKLVIYDPDDDILISDVSDSNTAQTGGGDYPAQGAFFVARTAGTYHVEVGPQSSASQVGPEETYELAIFLNEAAPALADEIDPVVTLTPDFANDVINALATDNAAGDIGICGVALYADTNLQITSLSALPAPTATFVIELVNPAESGSGKLLVTDCAGNTFCKVVSIDIDAPVCDGVNFSNRALNSLHDPIHVPNNDLTGIDGEIEVAEAGLVTDVSVTVTIDALDTGDLDIYLVSPSNTVVELVTDRMSSLGIDMLDTTFDDDADEILPILGSAAPYTGTYLPEDPDGLAQLNGEQAQGAWKLNVIDDSSSEDFGATLVRWSLDLNATFPAPQTFAGTASDGEGIDSIVLTGATNVQLNLPGDFTSGDTLVEYTVTLIDSTLNGSGTVTVTDLQENTCQSAISLTGLDDLTGPANSGAVTTDLTFKQEVQEVVPEGDLAGVVSIINVPDSFLVGEVEVALMVDSENQGRMAATLSHDGEFALLVNRIGMDERASSGNTKNSFDVTLDDDALQADDLHEEPALGTIETLGLHQPDGRGEFFGDGITGDKRDNMLFSLAGLDSAGSWEMLVADTRMMSSSDNIFRRWAMTLKNSCGPERYVGQAIDLAPGAGVCSIDVGMGSVNLMVVAAFTPGDEVVDYRVELIDPSMDGSGTVEIADCVGNVTSVPVSLMAASGDENLPLVGGSVNLATDEFEGTASDDQFGDTGIDMIELAPWSDNLQITWVSTLPAATADFTVGLIDPLANGRGYVQVTDACGLRGYALVEIDALAPVCTGQVGNKIRHFSGPEYTPIPDNNAAGVLSSIIVPETDVVTDVDLTFNITHPFAADIDMTLTSPVFIDLFSDLGSTGNDFLDTTLDDEAASVLPSGSSDAPFTGSWQPESGSLSVLDGGPASGTYTLKTKDDKTNDTGTFDHWSVLIESDTFPESFDGRAEDSATHDTGICSVEVLPGARNLVLTVDPSFTPGDAIVRYLVEMDDPDCDGDGVVRVMDCAGNYCEQPIDLVSTAPPVELALDIKPGSCPNPFNRGSHGVLPVALLGAMDFDAASIDLSSVRLSRADGVGGMLAPHEGPPGPHSTFDDVGTPFYGETCECHELRGDGWDDLSMKFKTDEVVDVLELDSLPSGALVELVVTGKLDTGCRFVASDCVRLVPPGAAPVTLSVTSNAPGVWVDSSPLDDTLDGGGFANFARAFSSSTVATVTADASYEGLAFRAWRVNGIPQRGGQTTLQLTLNQDVTVQAVYARIETQGSNRPGLSGSLPDPGEDGSDGPLMGDL